MYKADRLGVQEGNPGLDIINAQSITAAALSSFIVLFRLWTTNSSTIATKYLV